MRYWDSDRDGELDENDDGDHYYIHDANYNVTSVVDSSGNVLEKYIYTPYGTVTFLNPDFTVRSVFYGSIGNRHLYTGRERDDVTHLQLNRNRYYSSWLGRWLTRDPVNYRSSDWNLYEYVGGEPIIWVDPYGLQGYWNPLPGAQPGWGTWPSDPPSKPPAGTTTCLGAGGFGGGGVAIAGGVASCWDTCGNSGSMTCLGIGLGAGATFGGFYGSSPGCMEHGWSGHGQLQGSIWIFGGGVDQDLGSGDWGGNAGLGTPGLGGCITLGPCYTSITPKPQRQDQWPFYPHGDPFGPDWRWYWGRPSH